MNEKEKQNITTGNKEKYCQREKNQVEKDIKNKESTLSVPVGFL